MPPQNSLGSLVRDCIHWEAPKNSGKFNYGSPPEQRKLSFLAARERIAAAVGAEEGAEHVAKKSLF